MPLYQLGELKPQIDPTAWVAPDASLIGQVFLAEMASVWFGAVLRGDINEIHIGAESNVQDGAVIHLSDDLPTIIGKRVTVGHQALLHACTIGDECLIGMKATVMDGAVVGERSLIGAGALVTQRMEIPQGSLVLGSPAKVVRPLSEEEQADLPRWAGLYTSKLDTYRAQLREI